MARLNYVKAARKDIYVNGSYVNYVSKKGKREGQTLGKTDRTVPSGPDDKILIAKGESYYWWQFKNGPKNFSKYRPKRSQLTQSNYLSQLYDIQDEIDNIGGADEGELESNVENIRSSIESLRDETESSLDNMPESLRYSPTGELLQERIDALDSAISELESIDFYYEEPADDDIRDELADDVNYTPTEEEEEDESFDIDEKKKELVTDEMIEEAKQAKLQEWLDEKIEEIQGVSLEG